MAGLHTPLSTLHVRPHDRPRMTRGRCGSLLLHRNGLAPSALCRSPGAPDSGRSRGDYRGSGVDPKADLPVYSITSSARASRTGGISKPSVLAVLRLISSSYF